jgi:hypothetical protein
VGKEEIECLAFDFDGMSLALFFSFFYYLLPMMISRLLFAQVEEGRELVEQGQAGVIDLGNVLGALDMQNLRAILDSIQIVGAGNDGAEDGADLDFLPE